MWDRKLKMTCYPHRHILLYILTLRDTRLSQVLSRARLVAKRSIRKWLRVTLSSHGNRRIQCNPIALAYGTPFREGSIERADAALNGTFEFLGRRVRFDGDINWEPQEESKLWRFHLNYCAATLDFAHAFLLTGESKYISALCNHIRSWIDANSAIAGDAWSPYTASLRIVNWIASSSAVWTHLVCDTAFISLLARSVMDHLHFIRDNMEYDVRCNHLLENIKALIVGGIFLGVEDAGARYFRLGQRLLQQQLSEQVLDDGCHCERSMMYHSIVLEDLLMVYEAYRCASLEPPAELLSAVCRMAEFMSVMRLPHGGLPLLNDSVVDVALEPSKLLSWAGNATGVRPAEPRRIVCFRASGYMKARGALGEVLIFDCGEPCPPYQPAHAHADTLNFVYTLADGTDMIVDPGVYEYAAGPWRSYFRSTAAHNTVQLDGKDSTQVWGSFRAARKARILKAGAKEHQGIVHLFGEHDGYSRLHGRPVHRRDIYLLDGGCLLVLDTLRGRETHLVESRLHFHPDWQVHAYGDLGYRLSLKSHEFLLEFLCPGEVTCDVGNENPILGWYSPRFGSRLPSPCITWRRVVRLPYRIGFLIRPSDAPMPLGLDDERRSLTLGLSREGTDALMLGQLDGQMAKPR